MKSHKLIKDQMTGLFWKEDGSLISREKAHLFPNFMAVWEAVKRHGEHWNLKAEFVDPTDQEFFKFIGGIGGRQLTHKKIMTLRKISKRARPGGRGARKAIV